MTITTPACLADRRGARLLRRLSAFTESRSCPRASIGLCLPGEVSAFWGGKRRGEPSGKLAPTTFVNFLQNHDQIGNRALGDRLEIIADPRAIEAALAITLLAPMTRCCSWVRSGARRRRSVLLRFQGDLADAVRKDGAANTPGPTRNTAMKFSIRLRN